MSDIKWEPVDITPNSIPTKKAYARVTSSSITFNGVAASMIDNIEQYPWATVQVGTVDGKPAMLGFRFIKEQVPEAFAVKKQSKNHKGVTFFSRELVKRYFKAYGIGAIYLQQNVEKIDDNVLAVQLPSEENIKKHLEELESKAEDIVDAVCEETAAFSNRLNDALNNKLEKISELI